jgi:hypothetical protein
MPRVIVRTIIDLARSLNMKVTAEGVATEQQRDYLMARGCHELQGYLLSEPLPLEAFPRVPRGRGLAPACSDGSLPSPLRGGAGGGGPSVITEPPPPSIPPLKGEGGDDGNRLG